MTILKTDAVLLKKKDFRETSFILTFFTRDSGKIHGILKGVRGIRANSSLNPLFFSLNQIVYYEKAKNDLFVISHCETQENFSNILQDFDRALAAYYMLEIVDVFTEPGAKAEAEEVFGILLNGLMSLGGKKESGAISRLFEVKILMSLGLWPGARSFNLTKGAMSTLLCFEEDPWQVSSKIKLTREVGNELNAVTGRIISEHIDRPLKTVKIFKNAIM